MNSPLLSIITINRNNANELLRTLEGFKEWRRPEVEFLFVDGASTDNSLSIANSFYRSDEIRSEPDRGIYHAMNKGIARSNGTYLLFLNSGDHLLPGHADYVISVLKLSIADINTFGTLICWVDQNNKFEIFNPGLAALPQYTLPHQSTFFRRDCIQRFDGYDDLFKVAADRDLILRMFHAGAKIVHYSRIISVYYSGGISSSSFTAFEDIWIDIKQGHRPAWRLLLGWLKRPPEPAVKRFFALAIHHCIRIMRAHRRLHSS